MWSRRSRQRARAALLLAGQLLSWQVLMGSQCQADVTTGLAVSSAAQSAQTCLNSEAQPLISLPLIPLEARAGGQPIGVVIARLDGTRVLIRAEDLAPFNLTGACAPGQYLLLPDSYDAQLDLGRLTLGVTLPDTTFALQTGGQVDAFPLARSPESGGTVVQFSASAVVVAGSGDAPPGASGVVSVSSDSRFGGDTKLGLRTGATLSASGSAGQSEMQAGRIQAYLYRRQNDLETNLGLVGPEQLPELSSQQGLPLLGVVLHRVAGVSDPAPLRLESAGVGRYRVLYQGVILREDQLPAGTTLVTGLLYPPVQGELTIEITDASGLQVQRSFTVPFDQRPQRRQPGNLDYTVSAGLRGGALDLGASARYDLGPAWQLSAAGTLGLQEGVQAGVDWTPDSATSVRAQAHLIRSSSAVERAGTASDRSAPVQRRTIQTSSDSGLGLSLSRSQDWGSWVVRADVKQAETTLAPAVGMLSLAPAAVQRVDSLGLQASVFLARPALQLQGRLEGASSDTSGLQTFRTTLGISGAFGAAAGQPTGSWTVQGYLSRAISRNVGTGTAQVSSQSAGISVGLDLSALTESVMTGAGMTGASTAPATGAGTPRATVQIGIQDGRPQLGVQQTARQGDWNIAGALQLLPTPAASISAAGPVNASLSLGLGPRLVVASGVSGTLALNDSSVQVVPAGTQQLVAITVGVPGVLVRNGGNSARTDARGRAILPLPALLRQSDVSVDLDSLPLSSTLSVLKLQVRPAPNALFTVADFTPYLQRNTLRQLPLTTPVGAVARLGKQSFTVQESRYIQLDARNGDQIAVSWPGGSCTATWSDAEMLECR